MKKFSMEFKSVQDVYKTQFVHYGSDTFNPKKK